MRRRNKESATSSVSLFPFLAVLICTMGVMIILLVVASKAAEVHQQKSNALIARECDEKHEGLDFELQSQELKIQVLIGSRPQLLARLEQARLRRSHVENELRNLQSRFDESVALAKLLGQTVSETAPTHEPDIQQLQHQIANAETELDSAIEERRESPTSYAIVMHDSIHGTLRRPIYVECGASTITLQPSGIVIQASELAPPILPGNALDTALLTIREYWIKYDLAGAHGEPYPLLVVRPEGAQTYALARQAMQGWNDEFGYELIEQSKLIDFGAADPGLAETLRSAIVTARAQYAEIRRLAVQTQQTHVAQEQGSQGFRVSRDGGFEMVGGSISASDDDDLSQASGSATVADKSPNTGDKLSQAISNANPPNRAESQMIEASIGSTAVVPLANSRGANWALPTQNDRATAYRRPIVVYCDANGLTIDGASRPARRQEIDFSSDAESMDRFVHAIWQVMETWGIAERNGYWKPELQFVVDPGGRTTFERIQTLLDGCGFDVRRVTIK